MIKSRERRAFRVAAEARESADTQALLTCAEKEEESQEASTEEKVSLGGKCLVGWLGAQRREEQGTATSGSRFVLGLLKSAFCA